MQQLSKRKVEQIARRIAKHYGERYEAIPYENRMSEQAYSYNGPNVWPGEHDGANSNWIISWECSPADNWAYADAINAIVKDVAPGHYAEAIYSFSVGFYEA